MHKQGWYTKDRVKDKSNKKVTKKKITKKKVAIYYKKEFVYTYQVLKEYNIIYYQVGYPSDT